MCFAACGSKSFEGLLAPVPEWVFTDLSKWDEREQVVSRQFHLHGRGSTQGQQLISNRRALAEREAVLHAKNRFLAVYKKYLAAAHYAPQHLNAVGELPWEQIAVTAERFFDAEKNTQYALVTITEERLNASIRFEQSADLQRSALWQAIAEDLNRFYRVSAHSEDNTQVRAPGSL